MYEENAKYPSVMEKYMDYVGRILL